MAGEARTVSIQDEGLGCWWGGAHGHNGQIGETPCELESDEKKIFHVFQGVNREVHGCQPTKCPKIQEQPHPEIKSQVPICSEDF